MNFIARFFFIISICFAFFSCKNEVKSSLENVDNSAAESSVVPVPEKKEIMSKQEDQVSSVMVKSMVTPDLKTFSSLLVTVGLGDMLSKEKGPYTIIGPSNEAFTSLGQMKMKELLNTANMEELVRLTKSHVIAGNLDSASLVQNIKDGSGSYTITSLSGARYVVSTEGETIVITDVNGVSAQIDKSDIKGTNGVVHVLDKVLEVN